MTSEYLGLVMLHSGSPGMKNATLSMHSTHFFTAFDFAVKWKGQDQRKETKDKAA